MSDSTSPIPTLAYAPTSRDLVWCYLLSILYGPLEAPVTLLQAGGELLFPDLSADPSLSLRASLLQVYLSQLRAGPSHGPLSLLLAPLPPPCPPPPPHALSMPLAEAPLPLLTPQAASAAQLQVKPPARGWGMKGGWGEAGGRLHQQAQWEETPWGRRREEKGGGEVTLRVTLWRGLSEAC